MDSRVRLAPLAAVARWVGRRSPGRRCSRRRTRRGSRRRVRPAVDGAGRRRRGVVPAGRRLDGRRGHAHGPAADLGRLGGRRPARSTCRRSRSRPGRADGVVLVGADDGARSRLSLVDVGARLRDDARRGGAVVRARARRRRTARPSVEHRVDRATRADLGVWRRAARRRPRPAARRRARGGRPLRPDVHARSCAGRPDGRLAVTSCGEARCRTRIVDPASGQVDGDRADGSGHRRDERRGGDRPRAVRRAIPCAHRPPRPGGRRRRSSCAAPARRRWPATASCSRRRTAG